MLALAAPAQAQVPMTADSLKLVLAAAADISSQVRRRTNQDAAAQQRAQALVQDYAKHNAEPCEYPQGHAELCANYDRERSDLNQRSADLQKELKAIDTPRRALRAQFGVLMTRLRTATYAPALASQKARLIACSNLNGVSEAAGCLASLQSPARRPAN